MGKKSREKRERDKRSPAVPRKNDSHPLWLFLLIAGVAFLAYAHTLRFDFVFDDYVQILRNPWIRDWSKVGQFFTTDVWRF
jgi:hypothetical protein